MPNRSDNITYELKFVSRNTGRGSGEIMRAVLVGCGVSEKEIIEDVRQDAEKVSVYTNSLEEARSLRKKVRPRKPEGIRSYIRQHRDRVWMNKWKIGLKPFRITSDITVHPLRYGADPVGKKTEAGQHIIFLDTALAFGSGTHETTKAIATFLRMKRGRYSDLFDIGTGTGILSMVGARYGAETIWALDVDREAVRTANRNFVINGVKPRMLEIGDLAHFALKRKFDMVAANLLTDILLPLGPRIASFVKQGGYLAVSGISAENYPRFRKGFDEADLRCLRVLNRGDWVGVLYKKT